MFATAKYLKSSASNLRRTATSLRSFSDRSDLDLADRGVLLKAAQIAEGLAKTVAARAKERKAIEEKSAREWAKLLSGAKALFGTFPLRTTLDMVVMASLHPHSFRRLNESIEASNPVNTLAFDLKYWSSVACDEQADNLAGRARSSVRPIESYRVELQQLHAAAFAKPSILRLAERFDAAFDAVIAAGATGKAA